MTNGELNAVTVQPRVVVEIQTNGHPKVRTNLTMQHTIALLATTLNTLIQNEVKASAQKTQILKPGEMSLVATGKG